MQPDDTLANIIDDINAALITLHEARHNLPEPTNPADPFPTATLYHREAYRDALANLDENTTTLKRHIHTQLHKVNSTLR